ncbi:MAG: peptidase C25, partial [Olleya sp.]
MKKILLVLLVLYLTPLFSQEKKISLVWDKPLIYGTNDYSLTVPSFSPSKNFTFDITEGVKYVQQWKINGFVNENSLTVTNINYLPITKAELKDLNIKSIPNVLEFSLKNATARNDNYAVFTLSPIIKEGNRYKKVSSFTIKYSMIASSNRTNNSQIITNSVLSSGDWYKFEVTKSGVYKISKSFLSQMGINVNSLYPRNIKLFGNGGKMMPFANNANFPFDPTENAIKFIGEEDGVFDDSDYILFYAQGPSADVNSSYINTNLNPYTNTTVYYINISAGQGKRIQNFVEPVNPATTTFNTFHDYQFHELDQTSIVFVGRRWFGERFGVENSQSFDFNFQNLVTTEPVNIKVVTASVAVNETSFLFTVNNNANGSITLNGANTGNGVYATGATYQSSVLVTNDNVNITLDYDNQGNPSASAYLDYISVEATRALTFSGSQ